MVAFLGFIHEWRVRAPRKLTLQLQLSRYAPADSVRSAGETLAKFDGFMRGLDKTASPQPYPYDTPLSRTTSRTVDIVCDNGDASNFWTEP